MRASLTAAALLPPPIFAQETGFTLSAFLPLILLGAVFYFLLIRPQQRRAKAQRELVSSLEVNDRVTTIGGIHGTIKQVNEDTVRLEISPGTLITMAKQAVSRKTIDTSTSADEE